MNTPATERLLEHVKPFQSKGSIGVSLEDIARIPLTAEVISDVESCLSSLDVEELKWGLWFANGILSSKPQKEFLKGLLQRIPAWLKHENCDVRDRTLEMFIRLRDNFNNYKETMLTLLRDPDAQVRWRALRQYRTFLSKKDISALAPFQNDDYVCEIGMGGPLIYAIRDEALMAIEVLCGKPFRRTKKVKEVEKGSTVSWWDWQPFLDWWQQHQRGWRFWKW